MKVLFSRPPTREEEGLRGHLALRLRAAALNDPAFPHFYIALPRLFVRVALLP
jgi:hypothetical protein